MIFKTMTSIRAKRYLFVLLTALINLAGGCVSDPKPVPEMGAARLNAEEFIARDGTPLALDRWKAEPPRAVLITLHGMNDYANAFAGAGEAWSAAGISVFALDQRGFGRNMGTGRWPGAASLANDLHDLTAQLSRRYDGLPLYVLGHSMGGSVVMIANAGRPLDADGLIIAAPAIWGGERMPFFYRMTAQLGAFLFPGKSLTGARTGRRSTDNIGILREMQADPHVIKATRLRTITGLVQLMGRANRAVEAQSGRILYLYGCRDEIIPVADLATVGANLSALPQTQVTVRAYPEGWHLLFRDLQSHTVIRDVARWILDGKESVRN